MEEDLFQLKQLPVVKFRRTGESSRSEEDGISGEHEVQIEGVRTELEPVELEDGAAVPKEFANPTDDTFMVEDAVEAIGFGKFQWKLSVITGLAWARKDFFPAVPQVVFVGMMSSSTLWGNISDQYGRKTGLKISVLWTLYYGILSGFAPIYSWILVLRGLVGFGIGGVPQSVTLYAEFLPMKSRAKCILLIEVFWALGTVFEVLLAVVVMPTLGWRWLLILSALPLLLFAGLCFVVSSRRQEVKAKCSLTCEYLTEEDYTDLLWTTLSEFPGVLVTLWVIDRIGRKKTMALSFLVFSFCSLLLFLCVGRNVLTVLLFIARAFISGGFQAAYVYTPEVMLESSVYLTLLVYSGCCLLAALASCFLPIETKGRGLQESSHKEWGQEMVGRGSHSPGESQE
ncbi:synaptic vesicle 2-related protein-like protein [Turdus rufiventris]|nr:synaptic vesicle 2-related protein-like protein [Turdus rufiventris]